VVGPWWVGRNRRSRLAKAQPRSTHTLTPTLTTFNWWQPLHIINWLSSEGNIGSTMLHHMATKALPKIVFGSCEKSLADGNAVTANQKEPTPPTVRSELAPSQAFGPPAVALPLEAARSQELNLPTTAPPGLGGPTATTSSPTSHHVLDIENAFVQPSSVPLLPPLLSAQAPPFRPSPRHAKFQIELCRNFGKPEGCPYGSSCTYAHGAQELRTKPLLTQHLEGKLDVNSYRRHPCFDQVSGGAW